MKNHEAELEFEKHLAGVKAAIRKMADDMVAGISEQGGIPTSVGFCWDRISDLRLWKELREHAVDCFVNSLAEKCPEALRLLAKKTAISHAEHWNGLFEEKEEP